MGENQTETTADVKTRRNTNKTGDQYFTAEITDVSEGAILGFNKKKLKLPSKIWKAVKVHWLHL